MPEMKFRVQTRFAAFLSRIRSARSVSATNLIYLIGWVLFFYGTLLLLPGSFLKLLPILIIFFFFWFKLQTEIYLNLKPPTELFIALLLIFGFIESRWFHLFIPYSDRFHPQFSIPGAAPTLIQITLLGILVFLFSIILVQNSNGKKGSLIWYSFLGYIAAVLLKSSNIYAWIFFEIILLLILFRKTGWAEELTKAECWIYLPVIILLLKFVGNFSVLRSYTSTPIQNYIWYFIPTYLLTLFRLYLLATAIKIPFVLVYHHARLSRKLRIAGIFQSNVPQIIQLIILVLFFYYFIGGWQAENLRELLATNIEAMKEQSVESRRVYSFAKSDTVRIPGYETSETAARFPKTGMLRLKASGAEQTTGDSPGLFLFAKFDSTLMLQKVDSVFLNRLTQKTPLLAATDLEVYPFRFNSWDSLVYNIRFWGSSSENASLLIFPFSIVPKTSAPLLSVPWSANLDKRDSTRDKSSIKIINRTKYTLGRVYTRLLDSRLQPAGYCAFDITLALNFSLLRSPIARQILFWLVIYLLVNMFVIRQTIKFGNRINQMIVQKFNQLTNGIRQISQGNLDYKISLEGEDEFVELGNRFNQMGDQLKKTIAEVREKEKFEYELKIAREVQLSLLPKKLPEIEGYHITASFRTANEVGGDFYDVLPLQEGKYLFVIGDISGKGTSAAFYMAQCISLIRFARQFSDQPREILLRLNHYFSDPQVDRQIFLTAVMGVLDTRKSRVQLFRAGHPKPIVLPADVGKPVSELESSGLGIGLVGDNQKFGKVLKQKTVRLAPGGGLLFYTDGVTEASRKVVNPTTRESETEFFGETRLLQLLEKLRKERAENVVRAISLEIEKFYAGQPHVDDYTILMIRKKALVR